MSNPQHPQNRKNWQTTELEAGEMADSDEGQLITSHKVSDNSAGPIEFGTFCTKQTDATKGQLVNQVEDGDDKLRGVCVINNQSPEYKDRRQPKGTIAGVAKRGFVAVKIDPANPPLLNDDAFIYISWTPPTAGYLTNLAAGDAKLNQSVEGVEIQSIGAETAIVFLPGRPHLNIVDNV